MAYFRGSFFLRLIVAVVLAGASWGMQLTAGYAGQEDPSLLVPTLVKDINQATYASSPASMTPVGNTLFLTANDGIHGVELWKTNGTLTGTVMVADIVAGLTSGSPQNLFAWNSTLIFYANDGVHGLEPWISDGTVSGTLLLKDIKPGEADSKPANDSAHPGFYDTSLYAIVGDKLLFPASTPDNGIELWATDGTSTGTVRVIDLKR